MAHRETYVSRLINAQLASLLVSITAPYPAGQTLSNGDNVCNPAHQYPAGQSCDSPGPTPTLLTVTSAYSAGSTLSNGGYFCNPAHYYPAGQSCDASGPTPTLVSAKLWSTWSATAKNTTVKMSITTAHTGVATYTGAAAAIDTPSLGALALSLLVFLN